MITGPCMLWYDESPLSEAVQKAADHCEAKYGIKPELCLVHPTNIQGPITIGAIKLVPDKTVMKGHYWIVLDG